MWYTGDEGSRDVARQSKRQNLSACPGALLLCGLIRGELAATTADALAHGGAGTIIFTGRSQKELQQVIDHIHRKHHNTQILFVPADTACLSSVYVAATSIKRLGLPIDGILGFPTVKAAPWELTTDGIELHFQKNYLCYFLLVNKLLSVMSPKSRVIMMTTMVKQEASAPKWQDINFSNGETYHPLDAYVQAMFANIMFTKSLAERFDHDRIAAFSTNPGNVKHNVLSYVTLEDVITWLQQKEEAGEEVPIALQKSPQSLAQGSAGVLRALLDPDLEEQSGAFLDNNQVVELPKMDLPAGAGSAAALWKLSEGYVATIKA
ncbi:hypothetical protein N7468_005576 [Penicillium chermesinum]|uniref:Ketoreductase (KR) domain-containing protein n=1 Tax=Penicillium chermesinum TaxID=63820 RepID=A0A9W9P028_9EURO|nr:uncharacterized protein N7468_005576 [Penicillium chermesinum]KAJ5232620.1 hypothetical protein N7468_005576 [Penicillium chermesinum]KAJ6172277.1 hypothetical protein N7470_001344 [Penicillium chermesinum]